MRGRWASRSGSSTGAAEGHLDEPVASDPENAGAIEPSAAPVDETLREAQRTRILAAYAQSGGNISETARKLAISRNTVYRALGQKQGGSA